MYETLVTNPRLRIYLVALLCTFSISPISFTGCGHLACDAYEKLLRTRLRYRSFLALVSVVSIIDV